MKNAGRWRNLALAGSMLAAGLGAADWKPAPCPLTTPWTGKVAPSAPWPEYPRPQMVRTNWVCLNGLWEYAVRPQGAAMPERYDGLILVPFAIESSLSGVGKAVGKDHEVWYRRSVEIPGDGARHLLHFQAVDWHATVWVNGQYVGEHHGGYDPFTFDITALTSRGNPPAEIVVRVADPTDAGYQPRGKQIAKPHGIWYTAVTGIWQTVWIESVPETYIQRLRIEPSLAEARVDVTVLAAGSPAELPVALVARADGRDVARAEGRAGEALRLHIPAARPWSPGDPFLYDLDVRMGTDRVTGYFGLRDIAVRPDENGVNRLCLNGKPLLQIGPLDQGWWPDGLYTAPTDEALRCDIEITRAMGFNMTRKHVKVEPARWYMWCDRLGLLVWQDMPNGNNNGDSGQANFRRELLAVVDAFRNHPSIVMWVPFNEGWGQHQTEETAQWLKAYDPTRLVNNASGWTDKGVGDVHDVHAYPAPRMPQLEAQRAVVLGEFGGLGLPMAEHTWQNERNWGYRSFEDRDALGEAYAGLMQRLHRLLAMGLSASVYTQLTDVEGEVNGLLTYDRRIAKIAPETLAALHAALHGPAPIPATIVPCARDEKPAWRYTTQTPPRGWEQPDFDDTTWQTGTAGFGKPGTPGALVATEWTTPDIWLRRTFPFDGKPLQRPQLCVHHDEDAEISINGVSVLKTTGYTVDYEFFPLTQPNLLRQGTNTIAIHCRQTRGGQYIDAGIVDLRQP